MGSLSNLSVLETRFYNIFQKYYKGIHRKVVEVQVEGFSTEVGPSYILALSFL